MDRTYGSYDDLQLGRLLDSYRELAQTHWDRGHYARAHWARREVTAITIELNARDMAAAEQSRAQLRLVDPATGL